MNPSPAKVTFQAWRRAASVSPTTRRPVRVLPGLDVTAEDYAATVRPRAGDHPRRRGRCRGVRWSRATPTAHGPQLA